MNKSVFLAAVLLFVGTSAYAVESLTMDSSFASSGKSLRGSSDAVTSVTDPDTGETTSSGGVTEQSPLIGKLSTGVGLGMLIDAEAGQGYALVTQHKGGSKAFGSAYDSTAIYTTVDETTPGTVFLDVPTAIDESAFSGGEWRKM